MTTSQAQPLPFAVRQALIQACGTVFYYKGGLVQLFVSAGVPAAAVQRYVDDGNVKFQIARYVLEDLDNRGAAGRRVQDQIVDAILGLDGPADDIADSKAAKDSLETLRRATGKEGPSSAAQAKEASVAARKQREEELQRRTAERQAEKVKALRQAFLTLAAMDDRQERGYAFERFLKDLFHASDLDYRGSYKTGVEQIDGAFKHAGRDFLVEARWRELAPASNDLYIFAKKIEGKLQGTLGLMISMVPPRTEVLEGIAKVTRSVLIMDGNDLALILEGRLTLSDGLEFKRQQAAQEGILFSSLSEARPT